MTTSNLQRANGQERSKDSVVESRVPAATAEERKRFLIARKGNVDHAVEMLKKYMEFRRNHLKYGNLRSSQLGEAPSPFTTGTSVPQPIFFEDGSPTASDGTRLCRILPAMIDTNLIPSQDYAVRVAQYLDTKLDRNSMEKMTVIIDARGGWGWANPSPFQLYTFSTKINDLLRRNFPERLARCIIFPVPQSAYFFWTLIKNIMDADTVAKIVIMPGSADCDAVPPQELSKFVTVEALQFMERQRRSLFSKNS